MPARAAHRPPWRSARSAKRPRHALLTFVVCATGIAGLVLQSSASAGGRPGAQVPAGVYPRPSAYALETIPRSYLRLYWQVASQYGLDWTKLAAVGQIESDHGRSAEAGIAGGTNRVGAEGPAQFLAQTWARYGVDADGRGRIDPYDPADAITAMAAYLKASGAPEQWALALYTYNHSERYVQSVLALSLRFEG
jgi:membrane-bound lytic murein transglycosylase B